MVLGKNAPSQKQFLSRQKLMNFVNDREGWQLDYMHSMFFYLMSQKGLRNADDTAQHIFPTLATNNGSNASSGVTSDIMRKCVPYICSRYVPILSIWLNNSLFALLFI